MAENIGRALLEIPGRDAVSYLQKVGDQWKIFELSSSPMMQKEICETVDGKDHDMAWLPDGRIIMSNDRKIFVRVGNSWNEVEIRSQIPLTKITRMAVSPDGRTIAVVVNEHSPKAVQ